MKAFSVIFCPISLITLNRCMLPSMAQSSPSACLMSVTSSASAFQMAVSKFSLWAPGTCMITSSSLENMGLKDHLNLAVIRASPMIAVETFLKQFVQTSVLLET